MIFQPIEQKEGLVAVLDEYRQFGNVFAPDFEVISKVLHFFANGSSSVGGIALFVPGGSHNLEEVGVVSPVVFKSKDLAFGYACFNVNHTGCVIRDWFPQSSNYGVWEGLGPVAR